MNEQNKYGDIISLPHHISDKRKRMSLHDRAAQFSPFAALTGHSDALSETARLTDSRAELDESEKELIDEKLHRLIQNPKTEAALICFMPDSRKSGGSYLRITGRFKKFDALRREIVISDGTAIPVDNIFDIEIFAENLPYSE
ncbi:MAG: hypothetical protein IJD49_10325 [Clostridia bacterium]|nr:hypothetical protein [Clostridia bacterium]